MEKINVTALLASSLGRRDEVPNVELAATIVKRKEKTAVKELAGLLQHKSKDIQSDAIKVLYEIGALLPNLIAPYYKDFMGLLGTKNNRLLWGALTALDAIALTNPKEIYSGIVAILDAADRGSVIAKDHAVGILIKLSGVKQYADDCQQLLLEQLAQAAPNQLPMYAEIALAVMTGIYKKEFAALLTRRLDDMEKESKRKRVEKVLKKLSK
jgi:HEAT repeat protein